MERFYQVLPPNSTQALSQEGYFIWGASCILGDDGLYHIFASRWPAEKKFLAWLTRSTIVHATATSPEGPFTIQRELTELKSQPWSSGMVHNPSIRKIGDLYYLYYIGTTYPEDVTDMPLDITNLNTHPARFNQRIGVAIASDLNGPWAPSTHNPIFTPREKGNWDSTFVTNPSVFVENEDTIYLFYKAMREDSSVEDNILQIGLAVGKNPEGPFERTGKSPLFPYDVEDPFIWKEKDGYCMLVKDMKGKIAGQYEGIFMVSDDNINWRLPENPSAYTHCIDWTDKPAQSYTFVERPQLLIQDGTPICLYNAVGDGETYSFNVARRLKP